MDDALEEVMFKGEADKEAHFRRSIEPQLACNMEHVEELHRLVNEPQLAELAGRLSVEWLDAYPALFAGTQRELLVCAVTNAKRDMLQALLTDCRTRDHPDNETTLLWLSADYMVDFDACRERLEKTATDCPDFLWVLRDRAGPERGERFVRFSLAQLVFIVKVFGSHWSRVESPGDSMMGSKDPWDASEFIRRTIYAIASRPIA